MTLSCDFVGECKTFYSFDLELMDLRSISLQTADASPRSSSLRDVSRGGTTATQRQKFLTEDINQCLLNKSVQASEIKHSLSSVGNTQGKSSTKSYFGTTEDKRDRPCKVCNQKHPIWKCDVFKGMEHRKKWETAKKLGLCYPCLGKGHLGDSCTWSSMVCGIDGCEDRHHRE